MVALAGANFIHDAAGLMEFAMVASYEKYVVDNEIIGMAMRAVQGIEVTPETIGADTIKAVGPGGHFLTQQHTVKHMRNEFFFPQLSDREPREVWEQHGAQDTRQRANALAREILATHKPAPIQAEIDAAIREQFEILLPPELASTQ
jgi:trimethylamine--corrinoid protein Co-methyltransferase